MIEVIRYIILIEKPELNRTTHCLNVKLGIINTNLTCYSLSCAKSKGKTWKSSVKTSKE